LSGRVIVVLLGGMIERWLDMEVDFRDQELQTIDGLIEFLDVDMQQLNRGRKLIRRLWSAREASQVGGYIGMIVEGRTERARMKGNDLRGLVDKSLHLGGGESRL